ncbi:MAG: ABC transporter ATP-binding protein [Anaerolineales bacterium]|nr:ABC transporter ATP-binding protein [Anaerolineales bacterium]
MNGMPIVRFENVSKRFYFSREKPQSVLESVISRFSRSQKRENQDLWALKQVSFDVMPGQGFGFIGRNGSGKSTILKLISQILRPNEGQIVIRGRVSALLELGAGFHPDLTGRENIFLNAAVLGLSEAETKACFDDIVAFSELGEFINMPVKHYSSGMYMRLGFSVAIHVRPDILIVDEILAVGDQAFQAKCIDAILEMKRQGVTIIIVSHNMNMMQTLCSHLVWIEKGAVRASGPTTEVAAKYVEYSYERESKALTVVDFERMGDQVVEITAVRFLDASGNEQQIYETGDKLTIEMAYIAHKPIPNPEFGLAIHRQDGVQVNGPNTQLAGVDLGVVEGQGIVRYVVDQLPLLPAKYVVTTAVHDGRFPHCYDYHKDAYSFRIVPGGTSELHGLVSLTAKWTHVSESVDSRAAVVSEL